MDPTSARQTKVLSLIASDIKLAHSVFALPFAILGAFIAGPVVTTSGLTSSRSGDWLAFGGKVLLVIACMVLARTWAMLFNRLVDANFDAANARTQRRVFASGQLSQKTGWTYALSSAALFCGVTTVFFFAYDNVWPIALAVPVLAWIAFYSLTKRFTALCHVFLGGALAVSPLAAAIAIEPARVLTTPSLWYLSGFVMLWVAGFDVLYSLQDQAFDRSAGLKSIPAKFGTLTSLNISRGLHLGAFLLLMLAAVSGSLFGTPFWIGVGCVGVLLVVEHVVATRRGEAGLQMAFFTINGVVSCVLGVLGVVDILTG